VVTVDVERRTSRARIAVSAMFLTNGAIFANLVPRFPELKTELALSNTNYGIVVAAFPIGALVAGIAAGAVIRRLTSARTTLRRARSTFRASARRGTSKRANCAPPPRSPDRPRAKMCSARRSAAATNS